MEILTIEKLKEEAKLFAQEESSKKEKILFGVTDGKRVGTYFEHKFQHYLKTKYEYNKGSSANGLDFPELEVDMKVTSIEQPQSSCPFKSARQKIFGLGYNLLVFVYQKIDFTDQEVGQLNILHTIFVEKDRTADFQITTDINRIIENDQQFEQDVIIEDLMALFEDKRLPVDEIQSKQIAEEILVNRPNVGYLTISNALQWRLQYGRVISVADDVSGVIRLQSGQRI